MEADQKARSATATESLPGKRVGGAHYLHADALYHLPDRIREIVAGAERIAGLAQDAWNVVKLAKRENKVSLLCYQAFFDDPFPALAAAWVIDLDAGTVRHYRYNAEGNPPILHRKELLLPFDHPERARFAALTEQLEARGLLDGASGIGRRRAWDAQLEAAGVKVADHMIVDDNKQGGPSVDSVGEPPVARHKTAISRSSLSTPMQALARHGFLDGDLSIFDYGCGRGDDLEVLQAAGLPAQGWDPHYAPDIPKEASDVVNLGYVVNVIEEPSERVDAIQDAFALTGRVLSVAVLTVGRADVSGLTPYRDGFLTSRNTFQKYFGQEEAQELIADATGEEAIPIAPGVFFVFRNKIAEQRFLEGRARRRDISHLLAIQPPPAAPKQTKTDALLAENRATIEAVWTRAIELGRIPARDELDPANTSALAEAGLSVRKAISLAQRVADASALTEARLQRAADLRVYFALNLFSRRRKYKELPVELQRDVKAFFGSHAEAESAGREVLYTVSDPETILSACKDAAKAGLGHLFDEHSLQLHAELIPRLPEVLRVYLGCAEKLFGAIDPETVDVVKIHSKSGKLTLLRFDDFFGKALPRLVERVKIKMRERDIDYFDHKDDKAAPRLTMKSRYMASDQDGYERQKAFDAQLSEVANLDFSGYGPDAATLVRAITSAGYRVAGFELISKEAK